MPAFPVVIQQTEVPLRTVILKGRARPYRPVAWNASQRVAIEYFPGNPVAISQVIGPTFDPMTFNGTWKDIFLNVPSGTEGVTLINFPTLAPQAVPESGLAGGNTFIAGSNFPGEQDARLARVVRDAIDLLRKEGVPVRIEWGSLVRFGFITSTSFPHLREEDIEWEFEFQPTGDTDAQPIPLPETANLLSFLQALRQLLERILNAVLSALFRAQQFLQRVTQFINFIGSFVTELLDALSRLASFIFAPVDVLASLRANLRNIRNAIRDLLQELAEIGEARLEAAAIGNPSDVALNQQAQNDLRAAAVELGAEATRQEIQLEEFLTQELEGVITVPATVTTADISNQIFGNPNNALVIAQFNGLSGTIVPVGTVLRIPKVA